MAHHPRLSFKGTRFGKQGLESSTVMSAYRKDYKLDRELTIKVITHPVILEGELGVTSINAAV